MMIPFEQLVFYFFSASALFGALMVVTSKNAVRAVLFLVFSFFSMAGLWMLLEAEFLSIVLVLVYVGAVMVLFLFVVMMIDMETPDLLKSALTRHWFLGFFVACLFLGAVISVVGAKHFGWGFFPLPPAKGPEYNQVKVLADLLYSDYLLPFEVAGAILLVAMIAAIGLTFRGKQNAKAQMPGKQVQVTKADRLRIVAMPSVSVSTTEEHRG